LIIWDDCSQDDSWQIINTYEDSRIRKFRNQTNSGRGCNNIQRSIEYEANGEYIAIHHSDDVWAPTKLEKQVALLDRNSDIAAVFTHIQVIDEEGLHFTDVDHFYYKVFDQPNRSRYEWLNFFFYHGNALCHPSLLIRKACYDEVMYRSGLAQIPDFDLWIQLCLKHEIYIIQEKLTHFRVRDNEANVSGDHRLNRVRGQFEFLQVLSHYTAIASIDELVKIFPEARQYTNHKNTDTLYALARVALETGHINPIKLFGLNLLFEAINDPERANKLQKYQLFDQKAFIELTAKHDVFSVEELRKLNLKLNDRDKSIQQLTANLVEREQSIQRLTTNLAEQEQEILFYSLSKSWYITRPFRKIMKYIKGK